MLADAWSANDNRHEDGIKRRATVREEKAETRSSIFRGSDFQPALIPAWSLGEKERGHGPKQPREFVATFGLNQPGAAVAFKVFVTLTTDHEAGGAPLLVERPLAMSLAA